MINQISALVDHFEAASTVTDLVGARVFGLELPASEADDMPRKAVAVQVAGGVGPAGARDYAEIAYTRIDVFSYGETAFQAMRVQLATHDVMRRIQNTLVGTVLLYSASVDSGPRYLRDPDTDWPVVIESFVLMVNEGAVS